MTTTSEPLTLIRAAAMIGGDIKISALRAAANRGSLPAWKIGSRIFTTKHAVEGWLADCRIKVEAKQARLTQDARQIGMFEDV